MQFLLGSTIFVYTGPKPNPIQSESPSGSSRVFNTGLATLVTVMEYVFEVYSNGKS
jgi:hypothetical protein